MNIAIIADDSRKELMAQFCIAYRGIFAKHNLSATQVTGKHIAEATGLDIELLMSGSNGGAEQIASRISYEEVDMLFYFRDSQPKMDYDEIESNLLRLCDVYNVPLATNLATAQMLIMALDRGELDWKDSSHSRYKK